MDDENRTNDSSPPLNSTDSLEPREEERSLTADLVAETAAMTISSAAARGGGENSQARRRRRRRKTGRVGRPRRNNNSDDSNANPIVALEAASAAPSPPKRARRNNPIDLPSTESIPSSHDNLTPLAITVYPGENVVEKIMSFCEGHRRVVVLNASGTISSVTLRRSTFPGHVSYEGRLQIVSLTGALVESETESAAGATGHLDLTVSLALHDTSITGGNVIGPLIAGSQIRVVIGTYVPLTSEPTPSQGQIQSRRALPLTITEPSSQFDASASCSKDIQID